MIMLYVADAFAALSYASALLLKRFFSF